MPGGPLASIESAMVDEPPQTPKEGGLIREGYHAQLDELRELAKGREVVDRALSEPSRSAGPGSRA